MCRSLFHASGTVRDKDVKGGDVFWGDHGVNYKEPIDWRSKPYLDCDSWPWSWVIIHHQLSSIVGSLFHYLGENLQLGKTKFFMAFMKVEVEEKQLPFLIVTACYLFLAVDSCSAIPVLNWRDNKQCIVTYHLFSTSRIRRTSLVTPIILNAFFHIGHYERGCKKSSLLERGK